MTPTRHQKGHVLSTTLVRLPDDLMEWLREYAHERRISIAVAIREAVEQMRATQNE